MKYKGIELQDTSGVPRIINPPRKMLVWRDGDSEPVIEWIYAIGPSSMDLQVRALSEDGRLATHCYKHCAEIPKPRRATYREVSKWLAQGNGEVTDGCTDCNPHCKSSLHYDSGCSNEPCRDTIRIRKWDDTEWHEPTIEYMNIKEVG